jgi:hypothetical protein
MKDILQSGSDRETNNPAAGSELSQDELVAFLYSPEELSYAARSDGPEEGRGGPSGGATTCLAAGQAGRRACRKQDQKSGRAGAGGSHAAGTDAAAQRDSCTDLALAKHAAAQAPRWLALRILRAPLPPLRCEKERVRRKWGKRCW